MKGAKAFIQAHILSAGVDTLQLNVKYPTGAQVLPVELEVYCSQWQQQERDKSKLVATTITFHDELMTMFPNSAPTWKYIVKNDYLQSAMAARLHLPMLAKVTFASMYLWEVGNVHDALDEVRGLLVDLFGVRLSLQAAQIDLCVDLIGLVLPTEWEQIFTSHAIGKSPVGPSQKDRPVYRGRS